MNFFAGKKCKWVVQFHISNLTKPDSFYFDTEKAYIICTGKVRRIPNMDEHAFLISSVFRHSRFYDVKTWMHATAAFAHGLSLTIFVACVHKAPRLLHVDGQQRAGNINLLETRIIRCQVSGHRKGLCVGNFGQRSLSPTSNEYAPRTHSVPLSRRSMFKSILYIHISVPFTWKLPNNLAISKKYCKLPLSQTSVWWVLHFFSTVFNLHMQIRRIVGYQWMWTQFKVHSTRCTLWLLKNSC